MGQWLSSRKFAKLHSLNEKSLQKACFRTFKRSKKICFIKSIIINFNYINGIGGNAGKVLRIWSEPFASEQEAEAFMFAHLQNEVSLENQATFRALTHKSTQDNLSLNLKAKTLQNEVSLERVQKPHTDREANIESDDINAQNEVSLENEILNKEVTTLTKLTTLPKIGTCSIDTEATFRGQNKALKGVANLIDSNTHNIMNNESIQENAIPLRAYAESHSLDELQSSQAIESTCFNEFNKASQRAKNLALEKKSIIKEWERYKARGIKAKDFISLINASGEYSINVSENKLYAWQRAFKSAGLSGLLDERGVKRSGANKIKELGLEELVNKLILASKGRVNVSSMQDLLHIHLDMMGIGSYREFLGKESEVISYSILDRYVKAYLKSHPLERKLIYRGEDAAIGNFLPAIGQSNWAVSSINQIVEIDASSLDVIIDVSEIARNLGVNIESLQEWQKRFVLIALIDTYSGVCSFHISDTENSLGVARAIAKYIMLYGKPKLIKGDNGSAFVSKYIVNVLKNLDIDYKNTPAYSGWCKPYVERNFGALQNHLMEWMKGYIGHSVSQRQAIEFFFSRAQRRLKRGQKSNLRDLHTLSEMSDHIDMYAQSFMNNRYLQRLQCTPREAYNAKANESVAMNSYELSMALSPLEPRKVNKKGIAYGGVWYSNPVIFAYSHLYVAQNINNINELFVYDEHKNFIDIAKNYDSEADVSVEMAKSAQKIFKTKLKETKATMSKNRAEVEAQTPFLLSRMAQKMPKTKKPKQIGINNPNIQASKLKSEANKKVVGIEILPTNSESKPVKEDLSFEAAVLKKKMS